MKKLLSIILVTIILCASVAPCFAADGKCTCGEAPEIYVAALGSADIVQDRGTENEKKLFRPETSELLGVFAPLVPAAADLISTKNYDAFGDELIAAVQEGFGGLALDNDGNSQPNVSAEYGTPETSDHGYGHSYYFGYDFRLDPIEHAKELKRYIDEVKEITKHDSVRVRASSMGGVVMLAYLRLYGSDGIDSIILQNCPLQGTAVAGELFNGKVYIDKDALINYASGALPSLDSDFFGGVLYGLIEMFEAGGVWEDLVGLADKLVSNLKGRVFDEALIPIFGKMPGIWSFVPDEYYENGKAFMKIEGDEYSVLLEKLDFYHYEVQQKAGEILRGAQANGTNIYIVVGYNMQRTPLVEAYKNTSDGTVDTQYASLGATCAPIGEYLPEDYEQAAYPETKYISPDRMIDASTCLLPECTWFIKDMLHSTTHDGHHEMYTVMHKSEEQMTVFDNEKYPQFMQNDTVNQTFYNVTKEGSDVDEAIKDFQNQGGFLNFTKMIIEFFKKFWDFMMG